MSGLTECSNCHSKDTHRGLYGFEMELSPKWGKIKNLGVTKWVCNDCGHEDSDSTIINIGEESKS